MRSPASRRLSAVAAVDEDARGMPERETEKWYLTQLLFRDEAEGIGYRRGQYEDVEKVLVVGDEDVGATRIQRLRKMHPYLQAHAAEDGSCPPGGPSFEVGCRRAETVRDGLDDAEGDGK